MSLSIRTAPTAALTAALLSLTACAAAEDPPTEESPEETTDGVEESPEETADDSSGDAEEEAGDEDASGSDDDEDQGPDSQEPEPAVHEELGSFEVSAAPKQVAFTPDGSQIWVTLLSGAGVEVFDSETLEQVAEIDLGAEEHGGVEVIFDPDGEFAYVSQMETASAYEIDVESLEVTRQLPTEGAWSKVMALSPDQSTLYVSNWSSHDVSVIDLESGEVDRRIPTVSTPRGLYPTPDGADLYVAGFDEGELQRIELETDESEVLISTGGAMRHLVGDDERLFAGDMGTDEVFTVDLESQETDQLTETESKPNTMDLSPDDRLLYVSNRGTNNPDSYYLPGPEWGSVLVIDTETGDVLDAMVGGNQTTGLDVSDDGELLAISDFLDDVVTVYEAPTYEALVAAEVEGLESFNDQLQK